MIQTGFNPLRSVARWVEQHLPHGDAGDQTPAARPPHPRPDKLEPPQIGAADAAPPIVAGPLRSPRFLPTEVDYFKEARRLIESSKAGDMLCLQMYEFQNGATDGETNAARKAPAYADQQALLPGLIDAAKRGVKVEVVLDDSRTAASDETNNGPVVAALRDAAQSTGNITVDRYPAETVNIDHAKELVYLSPGSGGSYAVQEVLTGGSNWGNHTPANDDGGAAFFGRDAVGAAQVFFRDQAFCRGDRQSPPVPAQPSDAPVQWIVTSPPAEGGGSSGIRDAKLALTREADAVYMNDYVLTHEGLIAEVADKGRNGHVRLCPTEIGVNGRSLKRLRKSHVEAKWADTQIDPEHFPGRKNHEKLDVYVKGGVPFALTMGSANDSANGLEHAYKPAPSIFGPPPAVRRANHELDALVRRTSTAELTADGTPYSTAPLLDAALAKTKDDLANASLQDPPMAHQ